MKLENQVVNLELSKKLKELDCPQDSLWYWTGVNVEWELRQGLGQYSAFTVAELGEMLPRNYYSCKLKKGWFMFKSSSKQDYEDMPELKTDTEANARAKMLIYLLENKLIKND